MPHISSGPKSKLWSQSSPLTLLGWTVWKIFLSKFGAWTLLIKLLKQIHLCQYPWRRDGGNPNFRAVFVSNAKQYDWSSADVLFHLYLYCLQKLIASKHYWKKGGRHWKEECFSCDFWMQIGNLLSAVNSVFGVLLNMLCYLKIFYMWENSIWRNKMRSWQKEKEELSSWSTSDIRLCDTSAWCHLIPQKFKSFLPGFLSRQASLRSGWWQMASLSLCTRFCGGFPSGVLLHSALDLWQ